MAEIFIERPVNIHQPKRRNVREDLNFSKTTARIPNLALFYNFSADYFSNFNRKIC
jgi:hypothetical protein